VLALDPDIGIWGGSWSANRHYSPRRKFESMQNNRPKFVRQNPQESEATHRNITVSEWPSQGGMAGFCEGPAGLWVGGRMGGLRVAGYNTEPKEGIREWRRGR